MKAGRSGSILTAMDAKVFAMVAMFFFGLLTADGRSHTEYCRLMTDDCRLFAYLRASSAQLCVTAHCLKQNLQDEDCRLRTFIHCDPCVFFAILAVHNPPAGSCLNRNGRKGLRNGRYVPYSSSFPNEDGLVLAFVMRSLSLRLAPVP